MSSERDWLGSQVAAYRKLQPRYRRYAALLSDILQQAASDHAPLAIVQTRAKAIASFSEKALRKRAKYTDPVRQFTDLAGGRIIARNREEVDVLSRFIEDRFEIDWDNSIDASQRLRPAEFGYRSVHYIVSLRPDVEYGIAIPRNVLGLKAEIQVRTMRTE